MGPYIHSFSCRSQLEHRAPFGVPVITRTIRHTVGLLWTSDQPVSETSTYTGQHNRQTQETNFHVPSGIRTCDPSNQVVADLRLRPTARPLGSVNVWSGNAINLLMNGVNTVTANVLCNYEYFKQILCKTRAL
jgi:hypothetical protein